MQKWIILGVVLFIIVITGIIVFNVNIETEYIPETEIENKDLRKTMITLYFKNKQTGELAKEPILIDSKELLDKPYKRIIDLLLNGPQNAEYERIIPENVVLLQAQKEKDILKLEFSKEFYEEPENILTQRIESILCTVAQFTEINGIKFVNNDENITNLDFNKIYMYKDFKAN